VEQILRIASPKRVSLQKCRGIRYVLGLRVKLFSFSYLCSSLLAVCATVPCGGGCSVMQNQKQFQNSNSNTTTGSDRQREHFTGQSQRTRTHSLVVVVVVLTPHDSSSSTHPLSSISIELLHRTSNHFCLQSTFTPQRITFDTAYHLPLTPSTLPARLPHHLPMSQKFALTKRVLRSLLMGPAHDGTQTLRPVHDMVLGRSVGSLCTRVQGAR
jgi:hypothetical protein